MSAPLPSARLSYESVSQRESRVYGFTDGARRSAVEFI
jgi:hypothetical protein